MAITLKNYDVEEIKNDLDIKSSHLLFLKQGMETHVQNTIETLEEYKLSNGEDQYVNKLLEIARKRSIQKTLINSEASEIESNARKEFQEMKAQNETELNTILLPGLERTNLQINRINQILNQSPEKVIFISRDSTIEELKSLLKIINKNKQQSEQSDSQEERLFLDSVEQTVNSALNTVKEKGTLLSNIKIPILREEEKYANQALLCLSETYKNSSKTSKYRCLITVLQEKSLDKNNILIDKIINDKSLFDKPDFLLAIKSFYSNLANIDRSKFTKKELKIFNDLIDDVEIFIHIINPNFDEPLNSDIFLKMFENKIDDSIKKSTIVSSGFKGVINDLLKLIKNEHAYTEITTVTKEFYKMKKDFQKIKEPADEDMYLNSRKQP